MLPNLSVIWVIFFILLLTVVVDRLLLRPVLSVIRRPGDAIVAARPVRRAAASPAVQEAPTVPQPAGTAAGGEAAGEEHAADSGWGATIAKTVNFAILVTVLVYFLRAPLAAYLNGRIGKVREDLVTAAETREAASRRLAEIE